MTEKYCLTTPSYHVSATPYAGHAYTARATYAIRRLKPSN